MAVRIFGWSMLSLMAALLIINVLEIGYGVTSAFNGGFVAIGIYIIALAASTLYVMRTPATSLRQDSDLIHNFNVYLIRACFWAVLLVGIFDISIAFLRTESLLDGWFDEATVRALGRSKFVGTWVHVPLMAFAFVLAFFTRTLGFTWLALLIVAAELLIVLSRFVFSYEQAFMADLVRYWYAALFLFSSAYTLYEEGHVRVDVLYAGFENKRRGFVNAIGTILLGLTTCWVIIIIGFNGKSSIINSPVTNFEVSQTGSVGMFIKYQMAAFLGVFAITMMIQFVSYLFAAMADYREEPGGREMSTEPVSH